MSTSSRRIPATVERLALERAARIAEACRGIVAFGVGFKHTRGSQYGRRPRFCLKFMVKAKAMERGPRRPGHGLVPRQVRIVYRGKSWVIPTDVVAVGGAREHDRIAVQSQPDVSGVPSFAVGEAGAHNALVITAGHVLRTPAGIPDGAPVNIGGIPGAGRIEAGLTMPFNDDGLLDIGCAACPADSEALRRMKGGIWSTLNAIVEGEAFASLRRRRLQPVCSVLGAQTVRTVVLDSILFSSLRVGFQSGTVKYQPGIVVYRATSGRFERGDSGATIVLGRSVLAVHIVGFPRDPGLGYGTPAAGVMEFLRSATGRPLQIFERPIDRS